MSENTVIRLKGLGKLYKVYASPMDRIVDSLGLSAWLPKRQPPKEFWALRGIDLELPTGGRIGVVGRNGAGKTTLLKIITGSLAATEGEVDVRGRVHALMVSGTGFHPEFTGRENVRASLTYQGLDADQIQQAMEEIADFTELRDFLDQPFKTYSTGMQARLTFAVATSIRPSILIVDEVLGAGDAYFAAKCNERMRNLVSGGTSVLLVSHAVDHILMLCESAIWIDRGRVVMTGSSLEVVKAYEQFIRRLEDRRILAKRHKTLSPHYAPTELEYYSDSVVARLIVTGPRGARVDVRRLALWKDGQQDEEIRVGDAQDIEPTQAAYVVAQANNWSEALSEGDVYYRSLVREDDAVAPLMGAACFTRFELTAEEKLELVMDFRCREADSVTLEVYENGILIATEAITERGPDWVTKRLALEAIRGRGGRITQAGDGPETKASSRRRWPGLGHLLISEFKLLDGEGVERGVFSVGTKLTMQIEMECHIGGEHRVVSAVTIYRADGVLVSNHVREPESYEMSKGERKLVELTLHPLNLGDGSYVCSVGLYRKVGTLVDPVETYDIIDRSFEFKVIGNQPLDNGIFKHPQVWVTR